MLREQLIRGLLLTLMLILTVTMTAQAQNLVIGAALGVQLSIEDNIYIDDPIDFWVDKESGIQPNIQVLLPVGEAFRAGAYFTKETVNSEMDESFDHTGFGLTWLGNVPSEIEEGEFGIQMGGYLGYGLVSHEVFDGQSGMEMGVLIGPMMRVTERLEIAVHMASWSGYFSGGDLPEGILIHTPLFRVQAFYLL
jgi:hypothetical protein